MEFACKVYKGQETLLAACDKELVGKKLKFGEVDFEIRESFYFEKFISDDELIKLLKEANMVNLVGDKIVCHCIEKGIVNRNSVKLIDGVSHVQIYKL
jgi:uncharacterized protein